ncbi:MAG TPA: DUF3365 domain-containing protein [Rhizobiales bacterium]|nr:DUF3365 domain-containing protein [Hyphomicrobiales bacterium]
MTLHKTAIALACIAGFAAAPAVAGPDMAALAREGKAVMMEFGKALKGELKGAVKSGGFVHAIDVCKIKAPEIAAKVSGTKGWTVARSSHRLRNSHNEPDAFTKAAIDEFLDRQANGEDPKIMVKTGMAEEDGKTYFRMVKAIPTAKLCLNCHGETLKPEVEAALKKQYPGDRARGFKVGEMRGVFTLKKEID